MHLTSNSSNSSVINVVVRLVCGSTKKTKY